MAPLSLRIVIDDGAVTRTVKFDTGTHVQQAHLIVRDKILTLDPDKEYGFFLKSADDDCSGVWLEASRPLDYYMLRDGDYLHYMPKQRNLRFRMLDGTVKTLQVDESKKIGDLMYYICDKIGISNHEEYGFCDIEEPAVVETKSTTGTLTLKRAAQREKDAELQQLIKKFKTDNNVEWLDQHKTLRELRVDPKKTLLLKRRLFYSDRNVDSRDPLQLNLLYVQTRDAILDGAHVVTEGKAVEFAGLQCQVQYGDFQEEKHRPGYIENLKEFLPAEYASSWGVEKKVFREHRKHSSLSPVEAKHLYIKMARELPTFGVTFFVVKEKQKGKKKLVPRLLGINSSSILRLDEETKEILQTWLLTQVKTYKASNETFTLNFGDYSEKEYAVKTNEGFRIKDILEGYIDIIRKRLAGRENVQYTEGEVVLEDNVSSSKGSTITNYAAKKVETHSLVGPSQIIAMEQGHNISQGTNVTTVHQIQMTRSVNHGERSVNAIQGYNTVIEELSRDKLLFAKKLNYLNSDAVQAVVLLSDPTHENIQRMRDIAQSMRDSLPDIIKGVKETAANLDDAESKKLLEELDELCRGVNTLSTIGRGCDLDDPDKVTTAQNAAKKIADLSTQIHFSLDPKTRKRSILLLRSRESFIADERTSASLRRASFLTAADSANQAVESAQEDLHEIYHGPVPDAAEIARLENDAVDKMGKLNAAVALLLIAHADPKNVDYEMAVNSMKAIHDCVPQLTNAAKALSVAKGEPYRSDLLGRIRELLDRTKNICMLTGTDDTAKMQDAGNKFADVSKKLVFTFGHGKHLNPKLDNKDKEIKDLVMTIGNTASQLLMKVNELSQAAVEDPSCEQVDRNAVKCADAVQALLACARLTAHSIEEPHCQSALSAAIENLSSSSQNLSTSWKPMVEKPGNNVIGIQLTEHCLKLAKALEKLKSSYSNLNDIQEEQPVEMQLTNKQKKRLKFISTLSSAKEDLEGATKDLENIQPKVPGTASKINDKEAKRRLADKLAQMNAAIASLLQATADPDNHNISRAQRAVDTIRKLTPSIVEDAKLLNGTVDPNTWNALGADLRSAFEAVNGICDNATENDGKALKENISKYAKASTKLTSICSPRTNVKVENNRGVLELARLACEQTSALLSKVYQLAESVGGEQGQELDQAGAKVVEAGQALLRTAEVTAPSMNDPRCQASIISAVDNHGSLAKDLEKLWHELLNNEAYSPLKKGLQKDSEILQDILNEIRSLCEMGIGYVQDHPSKLQYLIGDEKQRLQFAASLSSAKDTFHKASSDLENTKMKNRVGGSKIDVQETRQRLGNGLAQLNAAIASLMQATADREKVNIDQAESAIKAIHELTPDIIDIVNTLNGSIDEDAFKEISGELKIMLDAAKSICDDPNESNSDNINELLSRFANSSGKLIFVLNPEISKEKEKQVLELSRKACAQTSVLLSKVYQLVEDVGGEEGTVLELAGARVVDAAQTLLTTAQITAPSLTDSRCQFAVGSAACNHMEAVKELEKKWKEIVMNPDYRQYEDDLHNNARKLQDTLDRLRDGFPTDTGKSQNNLPEKPRLKFTTSLSNAKNAIVDASKDLEDRIRQDCGNAPKINVRETQRRLADKLAQLNAAIASLLQATADRQNPDTNLAESATNTIREVAPDIVKAVKSLNGNMDEAECKSIDEDLKCLLEAAKDICDSPTNNEMDIQDIVSKFANSSGKLMFTFNPRVKTKKEKQVLDLSRSVCVKTSEMLTKVYQLAESVGGEQGQTLDEVGAKVVDAAQTLLTTAEVTAPSINDTRCQASLVNAVDRQSMSVDELEKVLHPVVQNPQYLHYKDDLQKDSQGVHDTLDKIRDLCQTDIGAVQDNLSKLPQLIGDEKQRLNFITTSSSAKNAIDGARKDLENIKRQEPGSAPEISGQETQRRLAGRLAQLNAAIASLMTASADSGNPDVELAQNSIETIRTVVPDIVKDAKTFSGNVDDKTWQAISEDLKSMFEATDDLCGHTNDNNTKDISGALSKFAAASGNLTHVLDVAANIDKEKQVLDLCRSACEQTSAMLSRVYQLAENAGEREGQALDFAGAKVVDAAQRLFTTAEVTAPYINNALCQASLVSAVDNQCSSAKELEDIWMPIVNKSEYHQYKDDLQKRSVVVQDILGKLKQLCQDSSNSQNNLLEKQSSKFITSLSNAKNAIVDASKDLEDQNRHDNGSAVKINVRQTQRGLADKLAQLNAAIASLIEATADHENPDTALAESATDTIIRVAPDIVKAVKSLNGNMDESARKSIDENLKCLLEAVKDICDSPTNDKMDIQDVASKFANTSGKLMFTFNPRVKTKKEKQVLDLSRTACEQTSAMLSKVYQLAESVGGEQGYALDDAGAKVIEAAQALLVTTKVTASSIDDNRSKASIVSAADKQLISAKELEKILEPIVQNLKYVCYKDDLQKESQGVKDTLHKLRDLCQVNAGTVQDNLLKLQHSIGDEKQRVQFITTLSSAKNAVDGASKDLENIRRQAHGSAPNINMQETRRRLADRLAQLNAAIASLARATTDRENPDLKLAESAIETIRTVAPDIVKDAKTLNGNVDDKTWIAISEDVKTMLEATGDLCGNSNKNNTKDINDTLSKFAAASGNLGHVLDPSRNFNKEKQVLDLSRSACEQTSAMLSKVYQLAENVGEIEAQALDYAGAKVVNAAQTLLTTVEITAPSINDARCQASLVSALDNQCSSAKELENIWNPIVNKTEYLQYKDGLQKCSGAVHDTLAKIRGICQYSVSEEERLQLNNGLLSSKKVINDAIKALEHTKKQDYGTTPKIDVRQTQRGLADKLAQLNAAIASLMQATADQKNPDIKLAESAIDTLHKTVPALINDVKSFNGNVGDTFWTAITDELKCMLEATSSICDNSENKDINEVVYKLGKSSAKLMNVVSPRTNVKKEKEVLDLSRLACEQTSAMLLNVYQLAENVGGDQGQTLDQAGAKVVDAAQILLSTSKIIAPSIKDTRCQLALISAAGTHSSLAEELESIWKPIIQKNEYRQHKDNLQRDYQLVQTTLDKLQKLCQPDPNEQTSQYEDLHVSEAKENIMKSEKLLDEKIKNLPTSNKTTTKIKTIDDASSAQQRLLLSQKLAKLNESIAQLVQAFKMSDREYLDHKSAQEAIASLSRLTPEMVQDIIILDQNMDNDCSQMLEEAKILCKASTDICARVEENDVKGINLAAIEYADRSNKLRFIFNPPSDTTQINQILGTAKSVCERTSLLLSRVSRLADLVEPAAKNQLHNNGTAVGDAAQSLLTTAQVTSSSIDDGGCESRLISSADNLLASIQNLRKIWQPLTQNELCYPIGEQLDKDQDILRIGINQLKTACENGEETMRKKPSIKEKLIIIEDCPLKQMAKKILSSAQAKSKSTSIPQHEQELLIKFCNQLDNALKAFDIANAKCRNQPIDPKRRAELESVIMNIQQMCLFSKDLSAEESFIVDLANYVKYVTSAAEDVIEATHIITPTTNHVKEVQSESQKIIQEASSLLHGFDTEATEITDDILKYDHFAKSWEDRVKNIIEVTHEIPDSKSKIGLQEKVQILKENTDLFRFAAKCNLSTAMGVSVDETLENLTDIEKHIEDIIKPSPGLQIRNSGEDVKSTIINAQEALISSLVSSDSISKAFAEYTLQMRSAEKPDEKYQLKLKDHLKRLAELLKSQVAVKGRMVATWQDVDGAESTAITDQIIQELDSFNQDGGDTKPNTSLAVSNEYKNLLMARNLKISGDNKALLDKFQKGVNKLSIDANTIVLSSHQPESLARCINLISETASQVASTARSIKTENPVVEMQIQDAAQRMCKATYKLLKVAQSLERTTNKTDGRRRLQDACRSLNDSINRLVRTVLPGDKQRESDEMSRHLQMQGAFLRAKLPSNALGYNDCLDALHSQQDVIQKLKSDLSMTKGERTESLSYITSAICNATEYATQSAYLLSLSKDCRNILEHGLVDVTRLKKLTETLRDDCMSLLYCGDVEQIKHVKSEISKQTEMLQKCLDDDNSKFEESVQTTLKADMQSLKSTVQSLHDTAHGTKEKDNMGSRINGICKVVDAINKINSTIDKIVVPQHSLHSQGSSQEIIDNTRDLVKNMSSLSNKAAMSDGDGMTWVMFGGADVVKTFDKLVHCIRQKGIEAEVITSSKQQQEELPMKSYIQTQIDLANKWLQHPASKPEVKAAGIKGIHYAIEMADKITEDLHEAEKEDMKQVVTETKQLLTECTQKYNSDKASLLMERLKELKKMLERGVVTRVVEDFLQDDPIIDMETLVSKEQDKTKRKFILERKIAELQAQLGKVTQTVRFVADTGSGKARRDLIDTSKKVELLAPSLVKAAQQRLESPENKEAIEEYVMLVEQYAKAIASMRDLCDRAVDPIDFAQAAGETMQRIKEKSSVDDPETCRFTSKMILRLGNRVVEAGMNSAQVMKDPEMQSTLINIKKTMDCNQSELQADWRAIFAEILQKTNQVESVLGGENIFNRQPEPNQPIFAAALDLHAAVREWSARDNDIVAGAKRMAVLMAKLSRSMETDNKRELIFTSKEIVTGAEEVAALARKLALECTDMRIRTNLLQVCDKIPTIGGQLKILTTVKGSSLGHQGSTEDKEAMNMLVCNAQNLMTSIQEVVKAAASASVKIMSQRGCRMKWVRRKNYY